MKEPIELDDDAGWCWFQQPRAAIAGGKLVAGAVGCKRGEVKAVTFDFASGVISSSVLLQHDADDHDAPAFYAKPDGEMLASLTLHAQDGYIHQRVMGLDGRWRIIPRFTPGNFPSLLTYQSLLYLESEQALYNFFRGYGNQSKPAFARSLDHGSTWRMGNTFMRSDAARPYVKYATDGKDTIHLFYTEGHPVECRSGLWHVMYRDGRLWRSDGALIATLSEGFDAREGTPVWAGALLQRGWCMDLVIDTEGTPRGLFSIHHSNMDHRYAYARWKSGRWLIEEIAHAGSRLYSGEDDYTGLAVIDPAEPETAYASMNVEPETGKKLAGWDLFKGRRAERGWTWERLTATSLTENNLRPVVVYGDGRKLLLWLRGQYRSYIDYDLKLMMMEL